VLGWGEVNMSLVLMPDFVPDDVSFSGSNLVLSPSKDGRSGARASLARDDLKRRPELEMFFGRYSGTVLFWGYLGVGASAVCLRVSYSGKPVLGLVSVPELAINFDLGQSAGPLTVSSWQMARVDGFSIGGRTRLRASRAPGLEAGSAPFWMTSAPSFRGRDRGRPLRRPAASGSSASPGAHLPHSPDRVRAALRTMRQSGTRTGGQSLASRARDPGRCAAVCLTGAVCRTDVRRGAAPRGRPRLVRGPREVSNLLISDTIPE
jgi:hypothetical protein